MLKVKDQEKILKAAKEKQIDCTGIRLTADFSAETVKARKQQNNIFKLLKEKSHQPKILQSSL